MKDDVFWFDVGVGDTSRTVALHGELDVAHAERFRRALIALDDSDVVVDLATLVFLDSSGLTALIRARNHLIREGRSLQLRGARGGVLRVFELTGLGDLIEK